MIFFIEKWITILREIINLYLKLYHWIVRFHTDDDLLKTNLADGFSIEKKKKKHAMNYDIIC